MTEATQEQKTGPAAETMGFQTEARQLLKLMIHSLYSNKEIFLRELISNAADATDKLRFEALSDAGLLESDPQLRVRIEVDPGHKTLTISDNGIGMSRDEIITNLGTIAKSGTAEFLGKLSGDQKKDSQLIGQFGVGFYSAFIVADRVDVYSRRAGLDATQGVHWHSTGEADFSVENCAVDERGTRIVLHIKPEHNEFLDEWRVRTVIKKYSDHISIPVEMRELKPLSDEESETENTEAVFETVNNATALWTRSRTEISDDEYKAFYKHVSHDFQDPLLWSHNRVEGKLEYTSLLYIPEHAPFDLWNRDTVRGLKLYVQRTFIMDDAEQFLPLYLRFVKGVIDSNDLSLNVSREILQKDPAVDSMRTAMTKRVLDMLEKMAANEPEKYAKFWSVFGQVLKEGPAEDFTNRDKIAKLFRFSTTHNDTAEQSQSLDDYIARMKEGQEKIYYVAAENFATAKNSPYLEVFRKKGIEVLLLHDRLDDWLMGHLMSYEDRQFEDVARGTLDLGEMDEEEKQAQENLQKASEGLVERVRAVVGDRVEEVRVTQRLTESPACLVVGENDMGAQMRRIMQAAGQQVPDSKPVFELNPEHPLVLRLKEEQNEARFAELSLLLLDQAQLAAGDALEDPSSFVHRLNKLLLELSA